MGEKTCLVLSQVKNLFGIPLRTHVEVLGMKQHSFHDVDIQRTILCGGAKRPLARENRAMALRENMRSIKSADEEDKAQ